MAEIRHEQEDIKDNQMTDAEFFPVLPPVSEAEEEKRDTECEVIKPHKEKVVVGEEEPKPTEEKSAFVDRIKKVEKRDWDESHCKREEYFFRDNRRKDIEQQRQRQMGQPVGKDGKIQVEDISQLVIFVLVMLFERIGIVDVAGAILRWEISENPQRGKV